MRSQGHSAVSPLFLPVGSPQKLEEEKGKKEKERQEIEKERRERNMVTIH